MALEERIERLSDGAWRICAPAKLNLGLRVFDLRADGFHPLETWMVPISWHDTLTYRPGGPLRLLITGRSAGVPAEIEKNLVGRAAVRLAREAGRDPWGVVELHKVLPPGGGLGGGSSDAANALVLLDAAWGLGLGTEKLLAVAAELGSDVPFFVPAVPSLCRGRGEVMSPLRPMHGLYAVLMLPERGMPTGPVFGAFDAGHRHPGAGATDWERLARLPSAELNQELVNDLEPAAFSIGGWLKELGEIASKVAGQKVHMTGSGSTLFTLCDSAEAARGLAEKCSEALGQCVSIPVRISRQ